MHCFLFTAMTSTVAKRPAPNIPPKPAPRRRVASDSTPDGAAVATTGNGSVGSSHDVTSSVGSSADDLTQLVAELPDGQRVSLLVDARSSVIDLLNVHRRYRNVEIVRLTIFCEHNYRVRQKSISPTIFAFSEKWLRISL